MRLEMEWLGSKAPGSLLVLAVLLGLVKGAAGQSFELEQLGGKVQEVELLGLRGDDSGRRLVLRPAAAGADGGGAEFLLPLDAVLALHGPAPKVGDHVAAYLVGGDELKGQLRGGDDLGEIFRLASATLGTIDVPVDRLRALVFRARAPQAGPRDFLIPEGAKEREALFRQARRGFDVILGALDRFTPRAVFFARGKKEPRSYPYRSLSGLALRGGLGNPSPGRAQLITTAGDLLRVDLVGVAAGKLEFKSEFGKLSIPQEQVADLSFFGSAAGRSRKYLSDLEPVRVQEEGSATKMGKAPLYPWRRDRTVSGGFLGSGGKRSQADGFLVAHGRCYGKGLGVHSRSILTYRVPKGMTRFHSLVGLDDEVLSLAVTGDADVRVRMGEKVLFEAKGLRRGQKPLDLGHLAVKPGALLTLEVDFGKALFLGDRVDWLGAVFLK